MCDSVDSPTFDEASVKLDGANVQYVVKANGSSSRRTY